MENKYNFLETIFKELDINADEIENVSDGYHTFKELYRYRLLYNAALFNELSSSNKCKVVKSWKHSDGDFCFNGGWFIVIAELPTGQVTNHYEAKYWNLFKCKEVDIPQAWDGHTPKEAADRLEKFVKNYQ